MHDDQKSEMMALWLFSGNIIISFFIVGGEMVNQNKSSFLANFKFYEEKIGDKRERNTSI